MMFLTIALTIWIPIVLGVAMGYLIPQLLVKRTPVSQEATIDRTRN